MAKVPLITLLLCVVIALSSCEKKNEDDTFKQITEKLFSYANQEKYDSLELIYPGIETNYLDLNSDSVRVVQINHIDESKIDVQIIKNFSPDSDPNTNKQKSITLNFEKCDSLPWGYRIYNSTGLLDMDAIPFYAMKCGAIKDKKYEDKDGMKRLKIADTLYHEKAKEVAEYLNKNVAVMVNYTIILGEKFALVDKWNARFTLSNPTEYSCLGFSVSLTLSDAGDGSLQANLNGIYENIGATLQAYSKHNYSISYSDTDLKKPNSNFKSYISSAKFHISPEAVEKYTNLNFSGFEYDNYTKK